MPDMLKLVSVVSGAQECDGRVRPSWPGQHYDAYVGLPCTYGIRIPKDFRSDD